MKKSRRYKTSHLPEDQTQPGSRGRVLINIPGIIRKREMDRVEAEEQLRALEEITKVYGASHRFKAKDVCLIHKIWLGKIYSWAGQYRTVNISKGGFAFAMSREIPKLMERLDEDVLSRFTPCKSYGSLEDLAHALAVVHVELVLIHPFREGNGRMARIIAILMALQAGLPVLDFGGLKGKTKDYISAIHEGVKRNYEPMTRIFLSVIKRTVKNASNVA